DRVSCHKGKKYNVKERMTNRKYPLTQNKGSVRNNNIHNPPPKTGGDVPEKQHTPPPAFMSL
ncbi:hypothetical protein, partial [Bacteroides sp.]|uniref:hypothetical protein n=1 Tax=Bacteroides sp. TaxID=29523 RepID=UPI0023C5046F